jgi:transposase-like protein
MPRAQQGKQPQRPPCPKCGKKNPAKSGAVHGKQRWKCASCSLQFTRTIPRGRPLWQKSLVVFLYCYGMPIRSIARLFQVQPSSALKWVRAYAKDYHPAFEEGSVEIMELEGMRRHLKKLKGARSSILCLAINNAGFKKSMGISLRRH